jgi:hypothetical protein
MGMAAGGGGGLQSEICHPDGRHHVGAPDYLHGGNPMLQHGITVNMPKDLNNPEETSGSSRILRCHCDPSDGEYYLGKEKSRRTSSRKSREDVG